MHINQILTEAPKVGRAFQHVEDLVMINGATGAKTAVARLTDIARNPGQVRWKWDGKPQVYWGREPNGQFIMTGHNGWLKTDGSGKVNNARELAGFIMGTGREVADMQQRQKFATEFASLWPLFEAATPKDFRGYVYADLLYMNRPPLQDGKYVFTPNNVTYSVDANSELGKRIAGSTAAAVGHAYFPQFGMGDDQQQPISDFTKFNQTQGLIVLGPRYAQSNPQVDTKKLQEVSKYIDANAAAINAFLNDEQLAAQKMAGFKGVLYNFNNQMAKGGTLQNLSQQFAQWLPQSRQSAPMQQKIMDWIAKNQKGFVATFAILENLREIKNQIINQIDTEQGEIQQSTKGQSGGEGYVMYHPQGNVKLVPRHRWTPVSGN